MFSIVASALLNMFLPFSRFSIFILPGLLFGFALTLPNIYLNIKMNFLQLIRVLIYPLLFLFVIFIYSFLQLATTYYYDKTSYIISGFISGIGIVLVYDWQFGFKNQTVALIGIVLLSILAILLGDYFFPHPANKDLNFGAQIAIWQIIVGFGIVILSKNNSNNLLKN